MNYTGLLMNKKKLAKPSGITLQDHTQHVMDEAKYILKALPFLELKYRNLAGENLSAELLKAARYHDLGKAYPKWQVPCQKDYLLYRQWRISKGLLPDELSAADHRVYERAMLENNKMPAPNLFKSGIRHEFASLRMARENGIELTPVVEAAIAAHHGKLGFRHERRWKADGTENAQQPGPFWTHWKEFYRLSVKRKELTNSGLLIDRYRFAAVRCLLQLADTRASRKEGEGEDASYDLAPFQLFSKFEHLRPVQRAALEVSDEPISILRAPTGSGKTYAALLWAEQQVKKNRADRLVIAMPTRFTSNALAISTTEQLGETGLYHSSAWFNRYGKLKSSEAIKEAREAHRMARYLSTPVTVCTIDHLLICLTGTKEAHHSTFFFLANSAVVLDEADFYDPFIQANIVVLIEVLRILKVPLLIMSATVPDSARQLYKVNSPIVIPDYPKPRVSKKLQWLGADGKKLSDALKEMADIGTGIIYANTVSRAFQYLAAIKRYTKDKDVPVILYHSRFTEPDKEKIENRLIQSLGRDAWEKEGPKAPRGIAIMTQIGEMSVNISTPLMISDLCPWDRLAQRIGRLARFEESDEGRCYVVSPQKDGQLYPAPYGEYDRKEKGWKAAPALAKTQEQLLQNFAQSLGIQPNDFVGFVNELYPDPPAIVGHANANQREYRRLLKDNWLMLPNLLTQEDEGHVGEKWSSRHIPPQQIVFVECPMDFSSYEELHSFSLQYGVSVPVYLLEKELRKKDNKRIMERKVRIAKQDETITVYYTDDYTPNTGFAFLYDPDFRPDASNQNL